MKFLLFGASGMVGSGALLECLDDAGVTEVVSVARSPSGVSHPKFRELLHRDFFDYAPIQAQLADTDACLFCLGVSSNGLSEPENSRNTYDLTMAAANAILSVSPALVFCFVSGQGTDSSGTSRLMWARVKGRTENALLALPMRAAYMFRPGFIQPMRGVRSKTRLYQAAYNLLAPIVSLIQPLIRKLGTTTVVLGRALIDVGCNGYPSPILETAKINRVVGGG